MVLLSFLAAGLVGGLLLGGRLSPIGEVRFRWQALAIGGLLSQLVLFSAPVAGIVGGAGVPIYVLSTVAVLAAVVRNLEQPWFRVIAFGAALNLLAIMSNGGVMPADPAALAAAGLNAAPGSFSNTAPATGGSFWFLGDLWVTPVWLPFRNVISIGDVLIGTGAAAWLGTVMLRGRPTASRRRGMAAKASLRLGKRAV